MTNSLQVLKVALSKFNELPMYLFKSEQCQRDRRLAKGLSSKLAKGQVLTVNSWRALLRILTNYQAEYDLLLPSSDELDHQLFKAGEGISQTNQSLTITTEPDRLVVSFAYDARLVAQCRELKLATGALGWLDPVWVFPLEARTQLIRAFPQAHWQAARQELGFSKGQQTRTLLDKEQRLLLKAAVNLDEPLSNGWQLYAHQQVGVRWLLEQKRAILAYDMGIGKAQPLTSLIMTPTGWRTMGELAIGDLVCSATGTNSKVTGIYPQGQQAIYNLHFSDKTTAQSTLDHLWTVIECSTELRTLTLAELAANPVTGDQPRYQLPMALPVQFEQDETCDSPYLRGRDLTDNPAILPAAYRYAKVADRISLLQGILLSRAVPLTGGGLWWDHPDLQVRFQLGELVESLAGTITPLEQGFQLALPNSIQPFIDQRATNYLPLLPTRYLTAVTYEGSAEAQCITVSAPDQLYLTNHCIPTHNTIIALKAAQIQLRVFPKRKIIAIVPGSLQDNWLREQNYVGLDQLSLHSWASMPVPPKNDFVLLVDEAHYAQNISSQRSMALLKLCESNYCKAVYLLTGTPMPNGRPINLLALLAACNHPLSFNRQDYELYFCQAHYQVVNSSGLRIWDTSGAAHLDELKEQVKAVVNYKHKRECLDLPDRQRLFRKVTLSAKAEQVYYQSLLALQQDYQQRVARGEISNSAQALVMLGQLRRTGAIAKSEEAWKLLQELNSQARPIVVFSSYVEVLKDLSLLCDQASISNALLIGSTPLSDRDQLVQQFQNGGKSVIFCSYGVGGLGITLTQATDMILIDRPWSPGETEQAESRIDRNDPDRQQPRIEEGRSLTFYWLQYGKVDQKIDHLLHTKAKQIQLVIGGLTLDFSVEQPGDLALPLLQATFEQTS